MSDSLPGVSTVARTWTTPSGVVFTRPWTTPKGGTAPTDVRPTQQVRTPLAETIVRAHDYPVFTVRNAAGYAGVG